MNAASRWAEFTNRELDMLYVAVVLAENRKDSNRSEFAELELEISDEIVHREVDQRILNKLELFSRKHPNFLLRQSGTE